MKSFPIALSVMLLPVCLVAAGGVGTPMPTDDIVCSLKDDDVLLKIGDHDVLKWGTFRKHLNALDEDVKHPNLQSAIKTATYKARFRKLLRDYVQYGVIAEAAKKWSDCESADNGGLLMDDVDDTKPARFEPGDNHPAIEKVCAALKEGEISEIAETPYAWHILKVMKRHPATDDEAESVELAHIMLEKEMLKPEFDEASAKKIIYDKTLRAGTNAEFLELYKQVKIECKVPLMDGESPTSKIKGGKK